MSRRAGRSSCRWYGAEEFARRRAARPKLASISAPCASRFSLRIKARRYSRPRLPGAMDAIFETGQLFGADRATGVKSPGGNPDFRAEAEFAAIGELGRCVVQHDRRIDFVEKFTGGFFVFGHDRIGVMRAVIVDMGARLVDAVDNSCRNDGVLVFGIPVLVGSRLYSGVGSLHGVVAAYFATSIDQHLD